MQLRKLFYLMLIIPFLFLSTSCSDDDGGTEPVQVNEAEVLAKYLDDQNVLATFPAMITAADLNTLLLTAPSTVAVLDIRSAADFANGHISGAVNVATANLLTYYETNNLSGKATVVIACYSGQTAGWATGLLRMLGFTNVKDLKWGMSSWNQATSGSWTSTSNVGNTYASQFTTTATAKNPAGDLPELDTGKENGADILRERVEAVLAEGFTPSTINKTTVFANLSGYYIVNYWPLDQYNWGHIPGAVQYTPSPSELTYATSLKTLPTDKPVVVYCYTGQTSAHVAAYLRVLGYDGKTLLFGVNGMSYDTMPAGKFNASTEIHSYDLVQ
ncbi:MAG: rhodanese-like domain-containing protein [Melioribacteraceae bacterium]|nr:rhodanese-like domain-containing protein [Melioribacteraceae bacterium]